MRRGAIVFVLAILTLSACGDSGQSPEDRVQFAAERYFAALGSPNSVAKDCLKLVDPSGPAARFLRDIAKRGSGLKGACGALRKGVSPVPQVGAIAVKGATATVNERGGPTVLTLHRIHGKWLVVSFERPSKKQGASQKNGASSKKPDSSTPKSGTSQKPSG